MTDLKLAALDAEDLAVLSAHCQDAVVRMSDMTVLRKERRFVAVVNRFAWEAGGTRGASDERRRSALAFARVRAVKAKGLEKKAGDRVLSLLALTFEPGEAPGGSIDLVFSGGATVRLDVEVIEASLTDLGPAWAAKARPAHEA